MSFDLDSLVDSWTPAEVCEFELKGVKLRFRACSGYGEYKQLERDANDYALKFDGYRDRKVATMAGSGFAKWRYLPIDHAEAKAAYIVRTLALDEITEEESFYMCKAPLLMDEIITRIRAHHYGSWLTGLGEAVVDEKKD